MNSRHSRSALVWPHLLISLPLLSVTISCRHFDKAFTGSKVKEQPDRYGEPSRLDIAPPYNWDDVKDATEGHIEHPWSDSYWPLAERGLALRYAASDAPGNKVEPSPKTLFEVVQSNLKAQTSGDENVLNYLSPAEKFDYLVSEETVPAALMTKLEQNNALYYDKYASQLAPLDSKAELLEQAMQADSDKQQAFYKQIIEMQTQLMEFVKTPSNETASKDLQQKIAGLVEQIQKINDLSEQKYQELKNISQQKRGVVSGFNRESMQLAQSLHAYMPMTASSFNTWYEFEAGTTEDYSWMGHCHGWAQASLIEKKPERAVIATKGKKSVLFTEGDIRGLLTKVWADQAPWSGLFFGARRCNTDDYKKDNYGRITDGSICYEGDKLCDQKKDGKQIWIKNNLIDSGMVEFTEEQTATVSKFARVLKETGEDRYRVTVFNSIDQLQSYNSTHALPEGAKTGLLHLTSGCRDVNPMTYHLALTKLIAQKKQGFVFDATRSSQVWNQPVYAYKLEYLPIQLNGLDPTGKTLSVRGELVPIKDIKDPLAAYRAPGTAYLITVLATVYYGSENGPLATYEKNGDDEFSNSQTTVYTLELDANKAIIGGEWGLIPIPDDPDNERVRQTIGGDAPDFIWYYAPKSRPSPGYFDADTIEKIHQCSLLPASGKKSFRFAKPDADGLRDTPRDIEIEYVNCPI